MFSVFVPNISSVALFNMTVHIIITTTVNAGSDWTTLGPTDHLEEVNTAHQSSPRVGASFNLVTKTYCT